MAGAVAADGREAETTPRLSEWRPCTSVPALRHGEVHVWRCRTDRPSTTAAGLLEPLDREERGRAERFRHQGARTLFVVARAALRSIAAGYLGTDPAALRFAAGAGGKPELAGEHLASGVRFNLSHTGDLVLLAFSCTGEVGVDVESVGRAVDWASLARRYFSAVEMTALTAVPESRRREAFLVGWCCKEALAKLGGTGLTTELTGLEVPIPLGRGGVVVASRSRKPCHLRRLYPGHGYLGALASEARPRAVRRLEWLP